MARSTARKRALNTLYEADIKRQPIESLLEERLEFPGAPTPLPEYAVQIVRGVGEHRRHIDEVISEHSKDWSLSRMAKVDRNILRLATWEIVYNPEIPAKVAIDEAIAQAKRLSEADSAAFIHGVLSAIADDPEVKPEEAEPEGAEESGEEAAENAGAEGVEAGAEAKGEVPARRLIVLTGPTAVGKGTVEAELREKHPELWISVSATTRDPRPGEVNGVNYLFVTDEEFNAMKDRGEFLETAVVHGMAQYGTPLKPVLEHLQAGVPTMLEIDLQGARRVHERAKELNLDVLSVFLAPPSFDDLAERLAHRGTETPEQRVKRLETAKTELAAEGEFDRVIVNDTVERAAEELWGIIADDYGLPRQ